MLDLYINIRNERLKREWSQQHLADLVGYKGKSMIAQIEKGDVDLSLPMITKFAEVFGISELCLMGWDEPEDQPFIYTDEMLDLELKFKQLSPENQKNTLQYIDFLLSNQND